MIRTIRQVQAPGPKGTASPAEKEAYDAAVTAKIKAEFENQRLRKILDDLLAKIEVMNGCNDHDFDVDCSDEAWPEFKAAYEFLGRHVVPA